LYLGAIVFFTGIVVLVVRLSIKKVKTGKLIQPDELESSIAA